ncbi:MULTISPECIES: hypothetical protein [Phyllobacteriaceae]|uniref:hypothetical protein n=1 Tax=Phyllobacteriaceae TaxID=69277 RepID=UPI0004B2C13B|nr:MULTISPECIES: hypothetical protein [Mesorhizobium]MBN9233992.1 hypothetical protein [Mesorhizobium sp.]MDQ0331524.1 hypothetical protein [Mesorhizobium sp. YL-MeA3-2017]
MDFVIKAFDAALDDNDLPPALGEPACKQESANAGTDHAYLRVNKPRAFFDFI